MVTNLCQRWRNGRTAFRVPSDVINTRDYEVARIPDDKTAKDFVVSHHYSRSYPAARFRFGLYHKEELVGVAVFSHPVNDATLACFPGEPKESVELGRLVLLDSAGFNAESFMVSQCFQDLKREGLVGVVSFSDPQPRSSADGNLVFKGHIGIIYQALNAIYLGRSRKNTLLVLPDGSVLHRRTLQKIRARESGWEGAVRNLLMYGLPEPGDNVDEWIRSALGSILSPIRHGGNLKYIWPLQKSVRRHLPASLPYLKMADLHGLFA